VSSAAPESAAPTGLTRRIRWRPGDLLFQGVALAAAVATAVLLGLIAWKVVRQAQPAIEKFGLSFVWETTWDPIRGVFGAGAFVVGTIESAFIALLLATPLSIAIAKRRKREGEVRSGGG